MARTRIQLANLKGDTGATGPTGPAGAPGTGSVGADAAVAGYVSTPASATYVAMGTTWGLTNVVKRVYIGSNLAYPRPVWPGPINWVTTVRDQFPIYVQTMDEVTVVDANAFPWTPLLLPGLNSWYAADTAGVAGGATVTTLNDLSLTAAPLRQPTGSKRPTYSLTGLNGRPGLQFDGTDDFMVSDAFTARTRPSTTVYAVIGGGDVTSVASKYAIDHGTLTNGVIGRDSSNKWVVRNGATTLTSTVASNNSTHIIKVGHSASATSVFVDGVLVAGPTANASSNSYSFISWGSSAAGAANFYNGLVGEYISTSNIVSADDEAQVYLYLQTKYGL